ncbi:DEAD/DEAH box helicase [Aquimarina intermedia]|uniref:Superfamily II DNA/RNA helicase n=1 Tax=Aquimarina intermedia TaxID=350814 RepID=A0A5S5BYY8_9FLAO|nr:DEAD/DEAH box helicase [Aquimarina intermedia]TYP71422.1 superfamily II DNA/RNA helicase [Aquimarina intermedia]
MSKSKRSQTDILQKLNIQQLNPMQEEATAVIKKTDNVVLLSPTGTGKTLAFLLPTIALLDEDCEDVQVLILVPSRELAIQIEQVVRDMGSGYKVNAVYGGRSSSKDKIELKHAPAILIGTPGRVADHLRQERFSTKRIKTLILDEFDKSLEVGFETEMKQIIKELPHVSKRILTSATQGVSIPNFVKLDSPKTINYLDGSVSKLTFKTVISPTKDKLDSLLAILNHTGSQPGIIFCNFKDSIQEVSAFLKRKNINHGTFHGDMEQKDRERSLIKFRNGTHQILLATDLAARGIDIPELKFIIHYQLPYSAEEFTHRNGRTARVNAKGTAFILKWEEETLRDFIPETEIADISNQAARKPQHWQTLFISGGRKDKISKGDIAGLFFKQGNLTKDQLGVIELKQDCTFVAVPVTIADRVVTELNNSRLKKKKVRITKI